MIQTRGQIEDIVQKGLVLDIFRMERAYALMRIAGERHIEINDRSRGNFGELFNALRAALNTEAVLALARIYDNPDKKYPTRCLKGVLKYLKDHAHELPGIREPFQLELSLQTRTVPVGLLESIDKSPADFPLLFSNYITSECERPEYADAMNKLKTLRDKVLAHNESADEITGPTWTALESLLDLAKYTVGVLGWAYFFIAYASNGDYVLTSDAKRPSLALSRLLDNLYEKVYPPSS